MFSAPSVFICAIMSANTGASSRQASLHLFQQFESMEVMAEGEQCERNGSVSRRVSDFILPAKIPAPHVPVDAGALVERKVLCSRRQVGATKIFPRTPASGPANEDDFPARFKTEDDLQIRKMFRRRDAASRDPGLTFDRPMVLFQSDDWGRAAYAIGRDGMNYARKGLDLGENPLRRLQPGNRRRSRRRSAMCCGSTAIRLDPSLPRYELCNGERGLSAMRGRREFLNQELLMRFHSAARRGLSQPWQRPGLMDAYQQGIREGVFYPALHGLTHFCPAVRRELAANEEHRTLLHTLWAAGTPSFTGGCRGSDTSTGMRRSPRQQVLAIG